MMIGTAALTGRPLNKRQTSRPSMNGKFKSRSTSPGGSSITDFSAAAPVATISTFKSPPRSRACFMMPAISGSSSTISTRVLFPAGLMRLQHYKQGVSVQLPICKLWVTGAKRRDFEHVGDVTDGSAGNLTRPTAQDLAPFSQGRGYGVYGMFTS